ncbi:glycosyltransferase [Lyngbya confervoides]|uniref:Glycosyltransferase n=1 Tax=Lyngbya confervoides BDU141951 TaxID=1574623 RepID=A0ABD4T8P3_9CYAN|nr:glycosyltransferase [Lyngbya confervoides]MCM1984899.1 glycosyltransferase [Lyngbya confervoides BDU141951]
MISPLPSIAILTWGLAGGALANNTAAMTKGFWEAGVHNIYLVYIAEPPGQYVEIPSGVKLVKLDCKRARSLILPLAKFLKEYSPDILIAISMFINIPATLGWLIPGKSKTKLILSQHSTMSYKAYVEQKNSLQVRSYPLLAKLLYPRASALRANSQEVLDDLLREVRISIPADRAITIPNPVNIEAVMRFSQDEATHPWLINKTHPVILSVARLAKQKNFPLLLEAFKLIHQQSSARLIIFGEGSERETLEKIITKLGIEEIVSLPGFTSNPWCNMAQSDVFVLPSEEEPFGLALVEAMACGVPVVATDSIGGGPRYILGNSEYGKLVPNYNIEALANSINRLLSSREERMHFSQVGKTRCLEFDPKSIAMQWLSFFRTLS